MPTSCRARRQARPRARRAGGCRVGALPSSSRCSSSNDRIESPPGAARWRAIRSKSSASNRCTATRKRPHGLCGPRSRRTSTIASVRGSERTSASVPSIASRRRAALDVPLGAEHNPQNHLKCQLSHAIKRDDPPSPGGELALGELRDHRRERPHPVTVERSLQQPPLAQMCLTVEQEDRVRPGERSQELPAAGPRGQSAGSSRNTLAYRVRVREQHHRLLSPVRADRDRVAEASVSAAPGTPSAVAIHAIVCDTAGERGPGGSCGAATGTQPNSARSDCFSDRVVASTAVGS